MAYGCEDCINRTFQSELGRNTHCLVKQHRIPEAKWHYCSLCNCGFNDAVVYNKHLITAPKHRTCEVCELQFVSVQRYEKHALEHRTCKACKFEFVSVQQYEEHVQKSHVIPKGPVRCHFCSKSFKSPSAYAQHVESGVHGVSRHQVTQAIHTLRVVPQITVLEDIEYTSARIEAFTENGGQGIQAVESDTVVFNSTHTHTEAITGEAHIVVPGPPLGSREMEAALAPRPAAPVLVSPSYQYFPDHFSNLGIPYACPICLKTFRDAIALTKHMNSPVHDPDAFKCPKCNRHLALVSGLIQHLESGTCKLASPAEIYTRFAELTAQFSHLLM